MTPPVEGQEHPISMARLGKLLLLLAFVGYPLWLHSVITGNDVGRQQLLWVLLPLLAGLSWAVFRSVRRAWWPLLVVAIGALIAGLVLGGHERIGLIAVNGLTHASVNLFLLWFFGRTLLRGREPLISRISRLVHGRMDPEVVAYTRYVTLAWMIYFSMQVIVSAVLYIFAPVTAWSFFVNVLDLPLLALMFCGEYIWRCIAHPDHPRASILRAIEVYSKDLATARDPGRH
jgi:uncharacterized membrane protein